MLQPIGRTNTINTTPPLEAVIFDLDDTLISWEHRAEEWPDYMRPFLAHICHALTEQNITVSPPNLQRAFGQQMEYAWRQANKTFEGVSFGGELYSAFELLGIDASQINIDALLRALDWKPMAGVSVFPDAYDVLDGIRARGLKVGLITNAWQPMWMRDVELAEYGLLDRLDARITSGDTGYIKPHPAIFWRMLGLLDTVPERAMMVGDSPNHDIPGGNAVGMTTVQMKPPYLNRPITPHFPTHTITTLSELLPIIDAMI